MIKCSESIKDPTKRVTENLRIERINELNKTKKQRQWYTEPTKEIKFNDIRFRH